MNSQLVSLNGDSIVEALAKYLSSITNDNSVEAYVGADNKDKNLSKVYDVLIENSDKILELSESTIDNIFHIAFAGLRELPDNAAVATTVKALVACLSKSNPNQVMTRLSLLRYLFNSLDNSSVLRFDIFSGVLTLVLDAMVASVIVNQLDDLDKWIVSWRLTGAEVAELYSKIGRIYVLLDNHITAQNYFVKALKAYTGDVNEFITEVALQAVVFSVKAKCSDVCLTNYGGYDVLLAFPAVQALQSGPYAPLYTVLQAYLNGSIADVQAVLDKHEDLFDKYDIDTSVVLNNIRALVLSDNVTAASTVALTDLAAVLKTSDVMETEAVLVEALFLGQITGKINQQNQTIRIDAVKPRVFQKQAWSELQARVLQWKAATEHTAHKA